MLDGTTWIKVKLSVAVSFVSCLLTDISDYFSVPPRFRVGRWWGHGHAAAEPCVQQAEGSLTEGGQAQREAAREEGTLYCCMYPYTCILQSMSTNGSFLSTINSSMDSHSESAPSTKILVRILVRGNTKQGFGDQALWLCSPCPDSWLLSMLLVSCMPGPELIIFSQL